MDARGTSSNFFCVSRPSSAILTARSASSSPHIVPSGRNRSTALRQWLAVAAIALVGCSADDIHSPQKFFPGSQRTSWDECSKSSPIGNSVAICATTGLLPDGITTAYIINFSIPSPQHVRIAVFDTHAARVRILFDADEPATLSNSFRSPPITWDFTDGTGHRVPAGSYRLYFQAGDFTSTSDVDIE